MHPPVGLFTREMDRGHPNNARDAERSTAVAEQASELPLEGLLRELTPQVVGAVARRFHDFAAAEDAVQEALLAAVVQWPRQGMPDNPRGWLIQVAARRRTTHSRCSSCAAIPR